MPNINLVAIDLDGTLLDNDRKISPRAKDAIQRVRQEGVEVTLATGRMFASAKPFADELGLNLPLITYQGALVKISGTGEVLYERSVPARDARQVIELTRQRGYPLNFYLDNFVFVENLTPQAKDYASRYNVTVQEIGDLSRIVDLEPIKLLVTDEDEEELGVFEMECRRVFGSRLHITKSMPQYLEFMHPEATKARGLEAVAKYMGITPREIMVIGDSYNDLEMLEYAGLAVVMGNAREEIKEAGDYITRANDDDGVAEALEKIILQER